MASCLTIVRAKDAMLFVSDESGHYVSVDGQSKLTPHEAQKVFFDELPGYEIGPVGSGVEQLLEATRVSS